MDFTKRRGEKREGGGGGDILTILSTFQNGMLEVASQSGVQPVGGASVVTAKHKHKHKHKQKVKLRPKHQTHTLFLQLPLKKCFQEEEKHCYVSWWHKKFREPCTFEVNTIIW